MDKSGISFLDLYHLLKRSKLRIILAAGLGAAIAVAVNQAMPVHYTSEALLEVESNSPLMKELNPAAPVTTAEHVRTEVDILQSRALADAIVRKLNLVDAPDFKDAPRPPTWIDWLMIGLKKANLYVKHVLGLETRGDPLSAAVELFGRRLQVLANEKSHIVAVRFQAGSPELSATVVNSLLDDYLASQVGASLDASARENEWLTEHLAALQRAVDEAAQRAQTYRDASGLVDVQAGAVSALQLNERQQALATARQELDKAQIAYNTASKALATGSGFVGQEALGSQLIQRLREREAEIMQRMANLRQRGGDISIYLPPVQAELASVRQQIAAETSNVVNSLRREVELARNRVDTLQQAVTRSQVQAQQNIAAAAKLAQLNQDVEAKRHVYIAFLTRMEQTQLAATKFPAARVISKAVPPFDSDSMAPWIVGVLGALAALFLTIAALLVRQVIGGRVTSVSDLEFATGAAPIGSMPALPAAGGSSIAMRILDMKQSSTVETLHALRVAIQAMNPDAPCTRVLVTSSTPEEGKSTLASSLARISAASGMRVLLIEGDLRRPVLARMLRMSAKAGIESLLTKGLPLIDAVHIDPKSGLHCLFATGSEPNVVSLLQSPQLGSLLAEARASYELVIIDSPPVMNVVDGIMLSYHSDVVLFAVASGRTRSSTIAEAIRRFPSEIQQRISTVLTQVPQSEESWRGYYSGYQHKLLTSA